MDPISLILGALVAGLVKVADGAPSDAYEGFKKLIRKKFDQDAQATQELQLFENDPDIYREPLRNALERTGAAQDPEVIAMASELRNALGQGGDKYFITEANGSAIGPGAQAFTYNLGDLGKA